MKVQVKLLMPHTDAGVEHPVGASLWLRPDQRDRLKLAGVCKDAAGDVPKPRPIPRAAAARAEKIQPISEPNEVKTDVL